MSNSIYGLVGKSLGHSFSKRFFSEKFAEESIAAEYRNFELSAIHEIGQVFETPNLKGLNVTIPYKTEVMDYLDEIDELALRIGAVNTIAFRNGKKIGFNTDAYGFQQSIKPFLRNVHERALILGTGGASKAVAYVLENLGIDVAYLTRNPIAPNQFSYNEANDFMMKAFKLIVNTTPLGTSPKIDEMPPIPTEFFTPDHLVVDLIYNPEKTMLLSQAEKEGADVLNGYSMLQHQALKAWELFNAE
jgi:shikimate dehydrogenase